MYGQAVNPELLRVIEAKRCRILRSFVSTVLSDTEKVLPITFLVILTLFTLQA